MSKTEDTVSSFPATFTPKMLSALIELTKSSTFDTDIGDESGFVQLDNKHQASNKGGDEPLHWILG